MAILQIQEINTRKDHLGVEYMLEISFGKNRSDTNWKPEYLEWEDFLERLKRVRRTNESMAEYDVMSKENKDRIKNGRAFVGGFVKSGRRKVENVENRWLLTLDADNADENFLFASDLILGGYQYAIYSTHSSRPGHLKYRLVLPADRAMTPDEHAAVSRKVADKIGMPYFDKTTFDVHRLMYLPSCSRDATPELVIGEGEPLAVDTVLNEYGDWRDPSEWPRHPDSDKKIAAELKKLGDPEDKLGVIGVFCKIYSIQDGIQAFIPDVYLPTASEDRWTYAGGSTFGGMRIYDDKWAYSEHQTDPANDGHCHNVFDLIRIHKYGHMDDDVKENTPTNKYPSYMEMQKFAINIPEVKVECLKSVQDEFDVFEENPDDPDAWKIILELDPKSRKPYPTAKNAEVILRNGPFKSVLAYDAFGNAEIIRGNLPWRDRERPQNDYEPWLGSDDNRMLHYFDKHYEFKSERTVKNAFVEVTRKNKFHPIKDYIESFIWDGIERIDTLFIDYLGAADDPHAYVRQVTRKSFLAAIKRIYEPGCKVDEMLVLIGPQGAGKSSLLAKLGRKWFSDSLKTFESKEAGEHLQSAWIFEISELSAMKKTEIDEVKAFLSKTEDKYRVAYDRVVSDFPRKCVFFGTTNTRDFLKDATGNRRFWPVDINPGKRKYSHWDHVNDAVVGQIWAEALELYRSGETLELNPQAQSEAFRQQSMHMEIDPREGIIQEWLDSPVDDFMEEGKQPEYRNRVCAAQIWTECLNNKKGSMRPWEAKEICDLMRRMPGWAELKNRAKVKGFGLQTAFDRVSVAGIS
jgi:hypothetical protein